MQAPSLSPEFSSALCAEHQSLAASVTTMRERADRLRALADQAEEHAARDERALRELEELVGMAPQLRLESLDRRLRGQRLREVAIQVLAAHHPPGKPLHYRKWYELLRSLGYEVGGRDPLATFLAQIARSSDVRRVGRRSGLYLLVADEDQPDAAATSATPETKRRAA